MEPRHILRSLLLAAVGAMLLAPASFAQTDECNQVLTTSKVIKLPQSCRTAVPIYIAEGQTLDGQGNTITVIEESPGNHFRGAIIRNTFGGRSFNVKNLKVVYLRSGSQCGARDKPLDPNDPNSLTIDDRLVGILFDGASGSVKNTVISSVNRGGLCSEGNGIEVRNGTASTAKVTLDGNTITGYGKTGIVANGNVDVTITDNLVDASVKDGLADIVTVINGIQLGYGATGTLRSNTITGNRTTAAGSSAGILVFGLDGPYCVGITLQANTLVNNDVGVFLSQKATGGASLPATSIKVVRNTITNGFVNSNPYQAGVSVSGNGDKLQNNQISGAGYETAGYFLIDLTGGGVAVPFN